jgi:hypothetical protein
MSAELKFIVLLGLLMLHLPEEMSPMDSQIDHRPSMRQQHEQHLEQKENDCLP